MKYTTGIVTLLLLGCLSLISATCPPSTPQTNQCGPNLPCADGSCCSAAGFCGLTVNECSCGCQSGACLIPSITMFRPQSVMNLTIGLNMTVTVIITTPMTARVVVDVVQENTNLVVSTTQATVDYYPSTLYIAFTPLWVDTTKTGVKGFYYRLSLIDINRWTADPMNAWQTPMDSSTYHGVTIAAAAVVTAAPTLAPATTIPPTTPPTTKAPTTPTTKAPTGTPGPTIKGQTQAPTTTIPTTTPTATSSPTPPAQSSTTIVPTTPTPTPTPDPNAGLLLDPAGQVIARICPSVGSDIRHVCQGCGYTMCYGATPTYMACPLGSTCNPNTNACESTMYCINNQASFQAPGATDAPKKTSTTASSASGTNYNSMLLISGILIGMMI